MRNRRPCFGTNSAAAILFLLLLVISIRAWGSEEVLTQFSGTGGSNPGASPYGGLISDSAGNFYGTTKFGGGCAFSASGCGVVFELVYSSTENNYSEKVLYTFTGGSDGGFPTASLIRDTAGNLYGTTDFGGAGTCSSVAGGCGVVFELVYSGGSYSEKVLHSFTGGTDGGLPVASLVLDGSGNLYGTTPCGGNSPCADGSGGNGIVFELVKASGYKQTVLHIFTGGGNGSAPAASVILDSSGNLYGTTEFGGDAGACSGTGCGVVFELVKTTGYEETVLHTFTGGGTDGGLPVSPVVADASGNLYGTTTAGGSEGDGVVFEIVKSSGHCEVLHSFAGTSAGDGAEPTSGLTLDSSGNLYGTTYAGGTSGAGVVFTLQESGAGYAVLYSFTGGADGGHPYAGVILPDTGKGRCPSHCGSGTTVNGGSGSGVAYELPL
jgi:uncharacterized repeat protein (TIGR03803 family)